jgi:uncharacterized protein
MRDKWTRDVFATTKPIIAMCHLLPLPGDPQYGTEAKMEDVVNAAKRDLEALQEGGVDGVMFSNEFSLPYLTQVEAVTVACMARIIGELYPHIKVPFGVNVLWDPKASLDLAVAVDARFVREIFTGVYASDFGLWDTNVGQVVRHQHHIGAQDVKLLFNIVPEAAKYLAEREFTEIAKSTVFNTKPDALCVSGLTAGAETDTSILAKIKKAVPSTVVFANTGVNLDNVEEQLSLTDGAVVGTAFKKDRVFENPVDQNNVKVFMDKVKAFRKDCDK